MSPLFDESGDEIEGALTPEEVEAKLDEKAKELGAKTLELESILKENKEKLEALSKKDINFEKTRERIKTLEQELEEARGGQGNKDKEIAEVKIESAIKKYTGDDKEMFEKVKKEFDGFSGDVSTEEEMAERAKKAFTLATGSAPTDVLSEGAAGFGGGSSPLGIGGDSLGKFDNPETATVANKMGVTNEELKKHGLI